MSLFLDDSFIFFIYKQFIFKRCMYKVLIVSYVNPFFENQQFS